jgi:hypothetical protein
MSEVWRMPDKARRVLQAAAVEAHGRPGVYITRDQVLHRANLSEVAEFWTIAEYLDQKGWINEADPDYGIFVVTPEGALHINYKRPQEVAVCSESSYYV